ncbi:MAG: hypothetical protein IJP18_02300 [Oscillospiraceae bacterium]|nr:hypothetical protein [Oscillospiraceae bacterium]
MRFKKVLCMATLATLLFPVVQNIEYVDAAEYSIDIVVDTVEIDINDIPEDRCVKVGISLRNNPGMSAIFIPLEKDSRIKYSDYNDKFPLESHIPLKSISVDLCTDDINIFTIAPCENIIESNILLCTATLIIPESASIGDYYSLNILPLYDELALCFYNNDRQAFFEDCFNITNGGIHIVGTEPSQEIPPQTELSLTESPLTEPPQTEPPQTELPQTEPPQTSTTLTTSTTIESITNTTTSVTTNESTVTTTENTTISMTSVTTTSSVSSIITTTTTETSEVTENKNNKSKNNLPLILAILASIGILGGIIGFIIKKIERK